MCSSQGRAYTVSWLVGVQIKVIATSDLWLFIHASNLLPSTPHPHSPTKAGAASRIGSRRVTHWPGNSVAELSEGTARQCRGAVWRQWDSVAELSGTEAVQWGPDHRASPTLRQLEGTWPPSFTYTDGWSATATATGYSPLPGACSLDSQALLHQGMLHVDGSWRMGSSVMGRLTNVVVPLNSWFSPAQFGPMSKRGQELHLQEVHCGAML